MLNSGKANSAPELGPRRPGARRLTQSTRAMAVSWPIGRHPHSDPGLRFALISSALPTLLSCTVHPVDGNGFEQPISSPGTGRAAMRLVTNGDMPVVPDTTRDFVVHWNCR